MDKTEDVVHSLTVKFMLEQGGFKKVGDWPIEWDASRPDSQYTLNRETIQWVIDALDELGKIKKMK